MSTRSAAALDRMEEALWRLVSYYGDPIAALDAAIEADGQWVLPVILKANALMSMTESGLAGVAKDCAALATTLIASANDRERAHLGATSLCIDGRWADACDAWERILVDHPQDLAALLSAHLFDFFRGDARNLQRRVARVLPSWSPTAPLYSYVLGMHAFGLEENNHYRLAQESAQTALAIEPRDPWSVHAIAHVHEMQGQPQAGADWLLSVSDVWSPDNGFAFHNWWHLALFRLEGCDTAAALALLDEKVIPGAQTALQRIDVTALLWRLHLLGVDVGNRWQAIAEAWPAQGGEPGYYGFNDLHAGLAWIGAGRLDAVQALLSEVDQRALQTTTLGMMAGAVAKPLLAGMLSYARGAYADAVQALGMARDGSYRFGGSHAQRDLIDLTLMDAAIRSGQRRLARHLLNERLTMKADSPLTALWARRIG